MAHPTTGAPAPSSTVEPDGTLDLHAVNRRNAACGYDHDLLLPAFCVQSIAANLRGICAIAAALNTEGSGEVDFGEWMRSGLIEAIGILATDAGGTLASINERVQKQRGEA